MDCMSSFTFLQRGYYVARDSSLRYRSVRNDVWVGVWEKGAAVPPLSTAPLFTKIFTVIPT